MMKKQSRHTHVDQVLIMIFSIVVVYEQGVGLKSSITADTAFRKDLPCRGVPTSHYGAGPSTVKGGPTGKLCPAGPHWLKTNLSGATRQIEARLANGKSAWATTRNV